MNAEQSDAPPSLLDRVQKLIAVAASVAALAAATGLPAVYVQYSNLGIPTSFITNEQIFRAGIAPGALFMLVGAYVLLVIHEFQQGRSGLSALIVGGPLSVIPIVGVIVILLGYVAFYAWLWWMMIYPVFWLIGVERARQVHFWLATGCGFLSLTARLVWTLFPGFVKRIGAELKRIGAELFIRAAKRWRVAEICLTVVGFMVAEHRFRIAAESTRDDGKASRANESEPNEPTDQPQTKKLEKKALSKFAVFAASTAYRGGTLLIGLFAVRWYLQQLDMSVGPLAERSGFLLFVLVGTLGSTALFAFTAIWKRLPSDDHFKRLVVTSLNVSVVALLFAFGVLWYSMTLYPRIPAALGGGKPEAVVVWMGTDDLPSEILAALKGANCTTTESTVRCSNLQLINRSDKDVILAMLSNSARTAVLVPRDAIKALSW